MQLLKTLKTFSHSMLVKTGLLSIYVKRSYTASIQRAGIICSLVLNTKTEITVESISAFESSSFSGRKTRTLHSRFLRSLRKIYFVNLPLGLRWLNFPVLAFVEWVYLLQALKYFSLPGRKNEAVSSQTHEMRVTYLDLSSPRFSSQVGHALEVFRLQRKDPLHR